MTLEEARDVVTRAGEGGAFDDVLEAYFTTPPDTREEARAYQELFYRVWDLVGAFDLVPDLVVPTADSRWCGVRVSQNFWKDHLEHSRWLCLVPDDRLVPVGCEDSLDESGGSADTVRLVRSTAGGGY